MNIPMTDEMKEAAQLLADNPNHQPWSGYYCGILSDDVSDQISVKARAIFALARRAMTEEQVAELEAWRAVHAAMADSSFHGTGNTFTLRFSEVERRCHFAAKLGEATWQTFHRMAEPPTPSPTPDTVVVPVDYLEALESMVQHIADVQVLSCSNALRIECGSRSKGARTFNAIQEARDAYETRHDHPAPPKTPGELALDLLERSYHLGREGSEDAAEILRAAGRLDS